MRTKTKIRSAYQIISTARTILRYGTDSKWWVLMEVPDGYQWEGAPDTAFWAADACRCLDVVGLTTAEAKIAIDLLRLSPEDPATFARAAGIGFAGPTGNRLNHSSAES